MSNGPPRCPSCGTPAERGQLVCVHCGRRLALARRSPHSWRPAALVAIALLTLAGVALGAAVGIVVADSGDDADDKAATQRIDQRLADVKRREVAVTRREQRADRREARAKRQREAAAGTWPNGVTAYTVVLVSAGDEASAQQIADEAKAGGLDAGVLRSDDYGLGQGFWLVYAGRFDTNEQAAAEAARLGEQYSGAYPQLVGDDG